MEKWAAANVRFGATAAGSADLKGSAKTAAAPSRHPVGCNARRQRRRENRTEKESAVRQ